MNANEMDCTNAMAALVGAVDEGTMSEAARAHLRTCVRCKELLGSLRAEDPVRETTIDHTAALAEEEVRRVRRWAIIKKIIGVTAALAVAAVLTIVVLSEDLGVGERVLVFFGGLAIATLIAAPLLLILGAVHGITRPRNGRPLYRRLGEGRMISGVCLGISEATNWNLTILRLAFLALIFFDGVGILIYILLALFMPVYPGDREHMLRFKLRRRFGRGES